MKQDTNYNTLLTMTSNCWTNIRVPQCSQHLQTNNFN